jgi:hypothetical protein
MLSELARELKDMPAASMDNRFVLWFLAAYMGEEPFDGKLKKAIIGGKGDGGIDAVLINDDAKRIFLAQGKYSKSFTKKTLGGLAQVAEHMRVLANKDGQEADDRQEANLWWKHLSGSVKTTLSKTLDRLKQDYELHLLVATTALISTHVQDEWKKHTRKNERRDVFDRNAILTLFEDYRGRVPYVGEVALQCKWGSFHMEEAGIESYLLPVRAYDLAISYRAEGDKLFARNVRGFLGENKRVNKAMSETLRLEPEDFWFRNNGVTIVCDRAIATQEGHLKRLTLTNPQIINGQQTVRVIAAKGAKNTDKAVVLVRVYVASHESLGEDFDAFIEAVVQATNFQNMVSMADLKAHHERMIELEKMFFTAIPKAWGSYIFLRKRGQVEGKGNAHKITKEVLAPILQACVGDPAQVRRGKEYLFEKRFNDLFPAVGSTRDLSPYLAQWWLHKAVHRVSKGKRERGYALWHVLHFVWTQLGLGSKQQDRLIQIMNNDHPNNPKLLELAIRKVFPAVLMFFKKNKGPKDTASEFFRRSGLHAQFLRYWRQPAQNTARRKFEDYILRFRGQL